MKRYAIGFVLGASLLLTGVGWGQAPAAPSNCSGASPSRKSITANWTDNADNENNLVLEYKKLSNASWSGVVLPANTASFAIAGLKRNAWYNLRVKATNSYGSSAYSNVAIVKTLK